LEKIYLANFEITMNILRIKKNRFHIKFFTDMTTTK